MTEGTDDALRRLQLATRLHGAVMPVIELLMSPPDGSVSTLELHLMCTIAERVERAADVFGPNTPGTTDLVFVLMQRTEAIRDYVDAEILAGRLAPGSFKDAQLPPTWGIK